MHDHTIRRRRARRLEKRLGELPYLVARQIFDDALFLVMQRRSVSSIPLGLPMSSLMQSGDQHFELLQHDWEMQRVVVLGSYIVASVRRQERIEVHSDCVVQVLGADAASVLSCLQ